MKNNENIKRVKILNKICQSLKNSKYDTVDKIIANNIKKYGQILKFLEYSNIKEELKDFNNFTDKMAIWYELKFPDSIVFNIFKNDSLILDENFFENSDNSLFSTKKVVEECIINENFYLRIPSYPSCLKVDGGYLYLASNGIINNAKCFYEENEDMGIVEDYGYLYKNIHITKIFEISKLYGRALNDKNNVIQKTINNYNYQVMARDILFNTIIYKILKRGNNELGVKRAYLFAKEFNGCLDFLKEYNINLEKEINTTVLKKNIEQ